MIPRSFVSVLDLCIRLSRSDTVRYALDILAILVVVPKVQLVLADTIEVLDETRSPVSTVGQYKSLFLHLQLKSLDLFVLQVDEYVCFICCRHERYFGSRRGRSVRQRCRDPEVCATGEQLALISDRC